MKNLTIPKIVERKIMSHNLPNGGYQYTLTIPKEYADSLRESGIDSLIVSFNSGLCCFPKAHKDTEKAIMKFLKVHKAFAKLFATPTETESRRVKQ